MGCTASFGTFSMDDCHRGNPANKMVDSGLMFSEEERMIIRRTWKYLANDLTGNGSKVFLKIFELYPPVKALFPCGNCDGEELLRNLNFKGHASRFMQAVGAVVDNIDDPDEALAPLLTGLGRQHIHYAGFQLEYFAAFSDGMTFVWAEVLGQRFTTQVANAWKRVFEYIMDKLREGYNEATSGRYSD